jgi:hypothetical protein
VILPSIGKIVGIAVLAGVALVGLVGAKWYQTAALEPIDPQRGIYGMDGLEIWIDINARMPAFARDWGCNTLRERERAALGGQNSLPPYSCQPGFGTMPDVSTFETVVNANLGQVTAELDAARITAIRACFDTRLAAEVTQDDIDAVNDDAASPAMSRVVIAVNEAARACKDAHP